MSDFNQFLTALANLLAANFDLEKGVEISGRKIPLVARSKIIMQFFSISKKIVLDENYATDLIICWQEDHQLTPELITEHLNWLTKMAKTEFLFPKPNMRTRFIGFMVAEQDENSAEIRKSIEKAHRFRWRKFGFGGWYEIFLIVYYLQSVSSIVPYKVRDYIPLMRLISQKLNDIHSPGG